MSSGIKQKTIIAMKGPPFTRKTELANLIAKSLRCPVLSLDVVLNVLHPHAPPTPSTTCARDLAFKILRGIAKSHLWLGVSENIIIDSRLSSQSHLDQLIKLVASLGHTRIVIIECKPKHTYSWQLKFENYLNCNPGYSRKWFKPKNWDDIEMAIQDDYDERLDGDRVSKLVLDPFSDSSYFSPLYTINPPEPTHFMDAVHYMIVRKKGDGPHLVVFHQWRQSQYLPSLTSDVDSMVSTRKQRFCRGNHCISGYSEEGLEHVANCMACEQQIFDAVYTCKDCSLALHKNCAESFIHGLKIVELNKNFSEKYTCTPCKEDGESFSHDCASCQFEIHLKCRAMPTIIKHDCEEHFLSIVFNPVNEHVYQCAACGSSVLTNIYTCNICNLAYHYECLTEVPSRTNHVHGGHHHHMSLKLSTEIQSEDYLCDECQELRDPHLWFYSCEDCLYQAHIYCVKERMPPTKHIFYVIMPGWGP